MRIAECGFGQTVLCGGQLGGAASAVSRARPHVAEVKPGALKLRANVPVGGEVEKEVFAKAGSDIEDVAFESLEVFESDVEEIAGTTRGVKHSDFAKPLVEASDLGSGLG